MLLVNVPGDASAVYTQLRHSAWNGCTIGDLVFPFFLFVVGITTHLSLHFRAARGDSDDVLRRQIRRRGALLFAIGLLLNWFPFYQYGAIAGNPSPTFIDHVAARLLELRFLWRAAADRAGSALPRRCSPSARQRSASSSSS
jgi:predicted acyltransferase